MAVEFNVMEQHLDAPRVVPPVGKLVLSRLDPGSSVIGAAAPSVKLVLEGEELYEVDGRTIRIRPGEYLYLDPGAACTGTNRTPTVGMCLMLPADAARGLPNMGETLFGRAVALSARTSAMGRALMRYGTVIARSPAAGHALASEIAERVGRSLAEPLAESRAAIDGLNVAKPSTRRALHARLERARAFLHDHLDRSVDLAELAAVASLSQFHLARYFKLAYGSAPVTYHRGLRLERAAKFLARGSGSVAEAAELVGYSDQTALSHAFRRHYGVAPRQWASRKRCA